MQRGGPSQLIASISILLILLTPSASSDNPETIASLDAYKLQRDCAQGCFWYSIGKGENSDGIADAISCQHPVNVGALDSCFCRLDLQSVAETYLSTCISVACSYGGGAVTVDISSAVSIYDNYCSAKGYVTNTQPQSVPANATPTTSRGGLPSLPTSGATLTSSTSSPSASSSTSTVPANPSSNSSQPSTSSSTTISVSTSNTEDSSGISTAAQVGLAVGCAFGATILAIIAAWWRPHELGRFICCGRWPRRHESVLEARREMRRLITAPFS